MRKILLCFIIVVFVMSCIGCKKNVEETKVSANGVATINDSSTFTVKFENIYSADQEFESVRLWAVDLDNKLIKDNILIDISSPVKNIYQRDFNGDGTDEIIVITEPYPKDSVFQFGVWTIDKDWNSEEVFYGDGSVSRCNYWFLSRKNELIHINSIRDYSKDDNAFYKSRFTCIIHTPKEDNGKLVFESGSVIKSKNELDTLKDIRLVFGIPEDSIVLSNIPVE